MDSGGDSSPAMEELLKPLTEVSIRQQQIVEHMAARQGETEREVAALRTATAPRVPPSDPRVLYFNLTKITFFSSVSLICNSLLKCSVEGDSDSVFPVI